MKKEAINLHGQFSHKYIIKKFRDEKYEIKIYLKDYKKNNNKNFILKLIKLIIQFY